jgi:hypothetical protein
MIVSKFTCIATGAVTTRLVATDNGVTHEDPDIDAPAFPVGWGDVTIRRLVENPDTAGVRAVRALEQATLDEMLADPDVPPENKTAERVAMFAEKLDETYPWPEPAQVWEVSTWSPLSPGAIDAGMKAMAAAGFPALQAE